MKNYSKSTYVLGINPSHNCSAALLVDGKIVASVSEERFARIKNKLGFPENSIKYLLEFAGIAPERLDLVVFGYSNAAYIMKLFNRGQASQEDEKKYTENKFYEKLFLKPFTSYIKAEILESIYYKYPVFGNKLLRLLQSKSKTGNPMDVKNYVFKKLGIESNKILFLDHHLAHAYSSFGIIDPKKNWLIITIDGEGDGYSASVNVLKDGKFKNINRTSENNSLGLLYGLTTHYLGMKRNEHEYKVMGLAPYAKSEYFGDLLATFKSYLFLDKKTLSFKAIFDIHKILIFMRRDFVAKRFDNIAGALQTHTESLIYDLVKFAIEKTSINNVVMAGGVTMNVKANQRVASLSSIKTLQLVPSATDESVAWGAAYWGFLKHFTSGKIANIDSLYLGPEYSNDEILDEFNKFKDNHRLRIKKQKNVLKTTAKLLAENYVVAWFQNRMEWGARALGNRSILANPYNAESTSEINHQIKNRDFWMPFAPSIVDKYFKKYIVSNNKVEATYMMISFETTELGRKHLRAAIHPADKTARAHIVKRIINEKYYDLIVEFEKITGIGAILNTSFNKHGDPIVCSPTDAFNTMLKTGLRYLIIGDFLVTKRN